MTWRDRVQQGKFRDVPFGWISSEIELGRRTAVYEIPGTELGAGWVDNGRRPWRQTLTVIVVRSLSDRQSGVLGAGGDYDLERNLLIEALSDPGPGTLVHPLYGERLVVIDGPVKVSESQDRGGIATFTFTAVEVVEEIPVELEARLIDRAASEMVTQLGDALADKHSIRGENFLRIGSLEALNDAISSVRKVTGVARSAIDAPNQLANQLDALTAEAVYLINSPRLLADSIVGLAVSVRDNFRQIGNAFQAYRTTTGRSAEVGTDIDPPDIDTPTRKQARTNALAIKHAMQGAVLAGLAEAALDVPLETSEDATAVRDALAASFRALVADLEASGEELDVAVFDAVRALQAATWDFLTETAGTNLTLRTFTPAVADPLPSFVVAYQVYGDATRAGEIEIRNENRIAHPGFVADAVEVLDE